MHRTQLLQRLLDRKPQSTYLEIGVFKGEVLFGLRAGRKIAVDPSFRISKSKKLWMRVTQPSNRGIDYFEMTSNDFFANHSQALTSGIDVAFVDGLHTQEQVYRDVLMCLEHLNVGGVIVLHDCIPPNAAAAQYAMSPEHAQANGHVGWTDEWTGDVFKSVMQLRAECSDLNVFVLDCDYGLGIVSEGIPESSLPMDLAEITNLTYEDFVPQQTSLLNIKQPGYIHEWLDQRDRLAADLTIHPTPVGPSPQAVPVSIDEPDSTLLVL